MLKGKKVISVLLVLMLVLTMAVGCSSGQPANSNEEQQGEHQNADPIEIKHRSGSTSGTWYPASGVMAEFLPKEIPGLTMTITPGAGQSNVEAIQSGISNFAIGKAAATFQGMQGIPPFTQKTDKVRNIGFLYNETWHLVVLADSGINSVEDLKGKSLTTQVKGNLAEEQTRDVLASVGLTYDDLKKVTQVSYDDSVQQMKDGLVDAFTFATAIPASVLMDLASVRDVKIISLDEKTIQYMREKNSANIASAIPVGTYEGQDEEVQTIGTATHMMVPSTMSDDLAYKLTKAIVENREKLGEAHVTYKGLTPEIMATDIGIPMHPGAEKYYKEVGAM